MVSVIVRSFGQSFLAHLGEALPGPLDRGERLRIVAPLPREQGNRPDEPMRILAFPGDFSNRQVDTIAWPWDN